MNDETKQKLAAASAKAEAASDAILGRIARSRFSWIILLAWSLLCAFGGWWLRG